MTFCWKFEIKIKNEIKIVKFYYIEQTFLPFKIFEKAVCKRSIQSSMSHCLHFANLKWNFSTCVNIDNAHCLKIRLP